jgi:L-amino acid N-acyltransferase YncA
MSAAHIRNAEIGDLPTIRALYAHHVEHSLGTFEEIAPTLEEMTRRWQSVTDAGLPYLACEVDGAVVGYSYAGLYRPRRAYRFSVEDSVYVLPDHARRGYGQLLLSALIDRCTLLGYRQMIAVIGDSGNASSIGLHKALGFAKIGSFPSIGFKQNRWVDVMLMQRALGDGDATPPADRDTAAMA